MVDAKIYGIITENGEEKLIREHESVRGRLKISLYEARRAKNDAELSRIIVRYDGRKVLEFTGTKRATSTRSSSSLARSRRRRYARRARQIIFKRIAEFALQRRHDLSKQNLCQWGLRANIQPKSPR